MNGEKSEMVNVLSGVPQGSVLEPLFFADDTKLFKGIRYSKACKKMQEDLEYG